MVQGLGAEIQAKVGRVDRLQTGHARRNLVPYPPGPAAPVIRRAARTARGDALLARPCLLVEMQISFGERGDRRSDVEPGERIGDHRASCQSGKSLHVNASRLLGNAPSRTRRLVRPYDP